MSSNPTDKKTDKKVSNNNVSDNGISRRSFLKVLGSGAAVGAAGCASDKSEKLIPRLKSDDKQVPGIPVYYSSTCSECSAGCGIVAKSIDGRVTKLEGNEFSPINKGSLCALGHSALQSLYDPDRVRNPLKRVGTTNGKNTYKEVSWKSALKEISSKLKKSTKKNAIVSADIGGTLGELVSKFNKKNNFEKYTYDITQATAIAKATELVFGVRGIPDYHFDKADVVLSFGADFLETWVSPCEYAKQWSSRRKAAIDQKIGSSSGHKNGSHSHDSVDSNLIVVEPRLSLTGSNADMWVKALPGTESIVALAVLNKIIKSGRGKALYKSDKSLYRKIKTLAGGVPLDVVASKSGVSKDKILLITDKLLQANSSLVIAGGSSTFAENGLSLAVVTQLINLVLGSRGRTLDVNRFRATDSDYKNLELVADKLKSDEVGVLFTYNTNPVFTSPDSLSIKTLVKKSELSVAFSAHKDETAATCDYILPINTGIESWGDAEPMQGVNSIKQPAMAPVFNTKQFGDLLLSLSKAAGNTLTENEEDDFYAFLKNSWKEKFESGKFADSDIPSEFKQSFDLFWNATLERGGAFTETKKQLPTLGSSDDIGNGKAKLAIDDRVFALSYGVSELHDSIPYSHQEDIYEKPEHGEDDHRVTSDSAAIKHSKLPVIQIYPFITVKGFDGRLANRPWMQELPDPITQSVWDSWVEIHPNTAKEIGVKTGDLTTIRNYFGEINVPVYVTEHVAEGIGAVPIGQGHHEYGRYAQSIQGGNVIDLAPGDINSTSGRPRLHGFNANIFKAKGTYSFVQLSGSDSQHGRGLARSRTIPAVPKNDHSHGGHGGHGEHHEPKQMYKQRVHPLYQWGMVVDLAACTGCTACVVACYAENNIPTVGKRLAEKGREMSWIRIERYYDNKPGEDPQVSFLPMMCQQCQSAPCEPVCPVYATYHNEEGLNVMVYNRCVGTRYCSNNCSYKVRRFNWVEFDFPEPLDWQLNPYVTKRGSGVMEKCSFCIQRINEAKDNAKDLGRLVADGEIKPACVQSCPTEALTFGNLNDPNAQVSHNKHDERAYKILDHHLNTQPSVTYLEDVKFEV